MPKPYYVLKRPGREKGRNAKSFLILRVFTDDSGKQRTHKHAHPELEELNRALAAGLHDYDYVDKRATEIRKRLNREAQPDGGIEDPVPNSPENEKLLERYWIEVYSNRDVRDPASEKNALKRAVKALHNVPLLVDDQRQIEDALNLHHKIVCKRKGVDRDPKVFNRWVSKIKQLRQHFGKPTTIQRKIEPAEKVKSLTMDEFLAVIPHMPTNYQIISRIAYATGLRKGEIFGLGDDSLKTAAAEKLYVDRQRYADWAEGPTKNKKARELPVFADGREWILKWLAVPEEEKREFRRLCETKAAEVVQRACAKAFPKEPTKWLDKFHHFRHCYARRILNIPGMTLEDVANYIGDDIQTTRKHYTRWVGSDLSMANALKFMGEKFGS